MPYCPYHGRPARWPKHDPTTCSMRCAAYNTLALLSASPWDTSHCTSCGHEALDQRCDNPKCPDYEEIEEEN